MIDYPTKELRNPDGKDFIGTNAYHVRTDKGQKFVLNPNGEHKLGDLAYDIKEATKEIYELRCDPVRLIYQHLKKEYKSFTIESMREAQRKEKKESV